MTRTASVGRIGAPLDYEAAIERAAQAAVLSDPLNLTLLSAIAAGSTPRMLMARFQMNTSEIARRIDTLMEAGLVQRIETAEPVLTANAWVRFGRLLVGAITGEADLPSTPLAALPPAVTTIIDDLARIHRWSCRKRAVEIREMPL